MRNQERFDDVEAAYIRGPRKTGFVFMQPEDVEWLLHELRKSWHENEEIHANLRSKPHEQ